MPKELVKGRRLELPIDGVKATIRMKLQLLLDEEKCGTDDWTLFSQLLLALRELQDLRGRQEEIPRE